MTEEDKFNEKFDKFKLVSDKHESLYIFVVQNITVNGFTEKIQKMMNLIDDMKNSSKRGYLKSRLYIMMCYLNGINTESLPNGTLSGVYFLSNEVDEFQLDKYWLATLKLFDCDRFIVKYDDTFDLDWLKLLLLDRSHINAIYVKNNDIKHYYLNSTKKKLVRELHLCTISNYISNNVSKDELCLVYGKPINAVEENKNVKILIGDKKDDELLLEYEKFINEKNSQELELWLSKLLDPKDGKKIVFGNEISKAITNRLLKTMYCNSEMKKKVLEKVPKDDLIFDIVEVKSFGDDVGKRLTTDFKGCIGIKFY